MASTAIDVSTLASLDPRSTFDMHFAVYKSSPRLHGSHYMALRKVSRTPEYTREYVPGDPVQLIDWKAYARTDQLLLREHRDESSAKVKIFLEATPTMLWPNAETPVPDKHAQTKLEIACRVAFHLAHVHLRMGDLVTIWMIYEEKEKRPAFAFSPRSPSDLISAFEALLRQNFAREELLHDFNEKPYEDRSCDLVWWVGDALSSVPFSEVALNAKSAAMIHTLSAYETQTEWMSNDISYFDEGQIRKEYRGQALKAHAAYNNQLAAWRERLQKQCRSLGGDFVGVDERTGIGALHSFVGELMRG